MEINVLSEFFCQVLKRKKRNKTKQIREPIANIRPPFIMIFLFKTPKNLQD